MLAPEQLGDFESLASLEPTLAPIFAREVGPPGMRQTQRPGRTTSHRRSFRSEAHGRGCNTVRTIRAAFSQLSLAPGTHLHSGSYFEPYLAQPVAAGPVQRGIFYLGLLMMIVTFPVTVPLAFVLMSKVPR